MTGRPPAGPRGRGPVPQVGPPDRAGDERGAGSVLTVAIVGAMLAVVALVAPLAGVLAAKQRTAGAADAAALAAADVAIGLTAGLPCAAAAYLASANGARLTGCVIDGATVTIRVEATVGRFAIASAATAGPPP